MTKYSLCRNYISNILVATHGLDKNCDVCHCITGSIFVLICFNIRGMTVSSPETSCSYLACANLKNCPPQEAIRTTNSILHQSIYIYCWRFPLVQNLQPVYLQEINFPNIRKWKSETPIITYARIYVAQCKMLLWNFILHLMSYQYHVYVCNINWNDILNTKHRLKKMNA